MSKKEWKKTLQILGKKNAFYKEGRRKGKCGNSRIIVEVIVSF